MTSGAAPSSTDAEIDARIAAIRWEPARAAAMTPNALADVALAAFRRAVEGLHRP